MSHYGLRVFGWGVSGPPGPRRVQHQLLFSAFCPWEPSLDHTHLSASDTPQSNWSSGISFLCPCLVRDIVTKDRVDILEFALCFVMSSLWLSSSYFRQQNSNMRIFEGAKLIISFLIPSRYMKLAYDVFTLIHLKSPERALIVLH